MDRRFIPLFIIVLIDLIGLGIIIPVLLLHAEDSFGASDLQATGLLSAYSLALFIAAPFMGRLSDAFGRRSVLLYSQAGTFIAFIMLGMANSLWVLYLGRIIDGISGGNITTARAYVNDITTEENRAQGFGIISAAFGAGFIIGPALGGAVVVAASKIPALAAYSQRAPFLLAALFSQGSIMGTLFLLPESLSPEDRRPLGQRQAQTDRGSGLGVLLRPPGVRLVLSFSAMTFLAFAMFQASFAFLAERNIYPDLTLEQVQGNIAVFFFLIGGINVVMQLFFVGPLVKRFGERHLISVATFMRVGAFLGIALARRPIAIMLSIVPLALGNSVSMPSLQSVLSRFAPSGMRGQMMGVFDSVRSFTLIFGPLIAGLLLQMEYPSLSIHTETALPSFVGAGLVFVAFLISLPILNLTLPTQEVPATRSQAAPAN